jgi:hypothetical protein
VSSKGIICHFCEQGNNEEDEDGGWHGGWKQKTVITVFSRLAAVNLDQGLETKALDTTVKVSKKGLLLLLLHKQGTNLPNIGFELVYKMGFSIRGPINLKQKNYIHLPNILYIEVYV